MGHDPPLLFDQPKMPQRQSNTVLVDVGSHIIRCRLHSIFGIAHGNTDAGKLQHFQVIFTVAEGDDLLLLQTAAIQILPDSGRQDGFFIARLKKESHE